MEDTVSLSSFFLLRLNATFSVTGLINDSNTVVVTSRVCELKCTKEQ